MYIVVNGAFFVRLKDKYMQGKEKRQRDAEISALAESLSMEDMKNLIAAFEKKTGEKLLIDKKKTDKFADFLKREDLRIVCPECKGKNFYAHSNPHSRKVRFYCNACKKAFSPL